MKEMYYYMDMKTLTIYLVLSPLMIYIDWVATKFIRWRYLKDKNTIGPYILSYIKLDNVDTMYIDFNNKLYEAKIKVMQYDCDVTSEIYKPLHYTKLKKDKFIPLKKSDIQNSLFGIRLDEVVSKKLCQFFINEQEKKLGYDFVNEHEKSVITKKVIYESSDKKPKTSIKTTLNRDKYKSVVVRKPSSNTHKLNFLISLSGYRNIKRSQLNLITDYKINGRVTKRIYKYEIIKFDERITILEPIGKTTSSTKIYLHPYEDILKRFETQDVCSIYNPLEPLIAINLVHRNNKNGISSWYNNIKDVIEILTRLCPVTKECIINFDHNKYKNRFIRPYILMTDDNEILLVEIKNFKQNYNKIYSMKYKKEIYDLLTTPSCTSGLSIDEFMTYHNIDYKKKKFIKRSKS